MATTFQLVIASDISQGTLQDSVAIDQSFTGTSDGTTGYTNTTGVAVIRPASGNGTVLVNPDGIPGNGGDVISNLGATLYVKNLDTTYSNTINLRAGDFGANEVHFATLHGGEIALIPLSNSDRGHYQSGTSTGNMDVAIRAISSNGTSLLEYALFYYTA